MQAHFVALASDIDAPEAELIDLAASNIPDAMMLPFVLFLDADGTLPGRLVSGPCDRSASGRCSQELVDKRRADAAPRPGPPECASRATPRAAGSGGMLPRSGAGGWHRL
jgi:hypothetical protein